MPSSSASPAAAASAPSAAGKPLFRERLLPGPGVWVVAVVTATAFGLIVFPISATAAAVTAVLMVVLVVLGLWRTSPLLQVERDRVAMGAATIAPQLLGEPEELDRDGMRRVMGPQIEPLAYRCTRGWIATGVRVPVLDPEDPAPAWVASSRDPGGLARAIRAAREA